MHKVCPFFNPSQGIQVEFTRPGHPQDNGSHERMHRVPKAETLQPSARNLRAQQRLFDRWRYVYNHERPHEALDMQNPAEIYHRSQRRLNETDNAVRYPKGYLTKRMDAVAPSPIAANVFHRQRLRRSHRRSFP